ncbi:MAG: hypothetical protein Q8P82_02675 [bacterium]|nr:hypothetical protein [bacterium]
MNEDNANASEPRECWCPCRCGCTEPDFTLREDGLCQDCVDGNHEVIPEGVKPGIEELLVLHRSIIDQYTRVLAQRTQETTHTD